MMAEKARLFGDSAAVDAILAAPDPKAAKALGRKAVCVNEVGSSAIRRTCLS